MNAIQKLRQLVDTIKAAQDPLANQDDWALAGRLLSRMPVDVGDILTTQNIEALDALVAEIENPAPKQAPAPSSQEHDIPDETLRDAMKAFRKRLKLARLNDESQLRGRRLTQGKASGIDAIEPPNDYPWQVWDALAQKGQLVDTGEGFYSLPGGPPKPESLP